MKTDKFKILFCPSHYVFDSSYGSEIGWAFNICDKICSIYTNSVVITGFKRKPLIKKYRIIELQKNKKEIDLSLINSIIFNILYSIKGYSLVTKEKFDILHHVLPFAVGLTFNFFLIAKKIKIPYVIGPIQSPVKFIDTRLNVSNLMDFKEKRNLFFSFSNFIKNFLKIPTKRLSVATLKRASKLVAVNEQTKKLLLKLGIDDEKIAVIPPGIDTKRFYPEENKNFDIIELISVGYLSERKGFDIIIKSFSKIVKKNKKVRLRIVGDGPRKNDLVSLVKKLNLEKFVIFEGFVSNEKINEFYRKAHIFVNMSKEECFATTCLEGLASGLPIISSKVGGFEDAVIDDFNGYLIKERSCELLAKKILYLINNKDLILKFGRNSRKMAEKKYDWNKVIIPKYLNLYKEILESK